MDQDTIANTTENLPVKLISETKTKVSIPITNSEIATSPGRVTITAATKAPQITATAVTPSPLHQAPLATGTCTKHIYISESDTSASTTSESEAEEHTKPNNKPEEIFVPKYLQQASKITTPTIEAPSILNKRKEITKTTTTLQPKSPTKTIKTPQPKNSSPKITPPPSPKRPKIVTRSHKCPLCINDFTAPLLQHLNQKHYDILKCRICGTQLNTNMMDHFVNVHPIAIAYKCAYCENEAAVHTSKEQLRALLTSWHPRLKPVHDKVNIQLNKEDNIIINYTEDDDN